MNHKPRTTNTAMKHIRDFYKIDIAGSKDKLLLRNNGYYHAFKGYRVYNPNSQNIPFKFQNFKELCALLEFDNALKKEIYTEIMFIEIALKNIVLQEILDYAKTDITSEINNVIFMTYKNAPSNFNSKQRKFVQKGTLYVLSEIQNAIKNYYEKDIKLQHFLNSNKYSQVPYWCLFEILQMGTFGSLVKQLVKPLRFKILKDLDLNTPLDNNHEFLEKIIFTLKELRNALAHNAPIFDVRFKRSEVSFSLKKYLKTELKFHNISFNNIIDYIALIVVVNKKIGVEKTHQKQFVKQIEKNIHVFQKEVNNSVFTTIFNNNWAQQIQLILNYIK